MHDEKKVGGGDQPPGNVPDATDRVTSSTTPASPTIEFADEEPGKTSSPLSAGKGTDDTTIRAERAAATGTPPEAPITAADRAKFGTESGVGDRAASAPDGANRAAGVGKEPSTLEAIATRAGRAGELAPLGDPDAPQGTGKEHDESNPATRPAPVGKIRFADDDPRSDN